MKPRKKRPHPPNPPPHDDLRRVETLLKQQLEVQREQLDVQRDILKAVTSGSLESRVTIEPGTPRFYAKSSLPHHSNNHRN